MKTEKTVATFFSIAFVGACMLCGSAALAQGSALSFHGQLLNAGCEARVLHVPGHPHDPRFLSVNASLTMGLVNHDDACDGAAVPVSMAFAERTSFAVGAHSGVVTLTYQ